MLLKAISPVVLTKVKAPIEPPATTEYQMDEPDNNDICETEATPEETTDAPTSFATSANEREFSIYETPAEPLAISSMDANHPYVPASTLDFTFIEDTAIPKSALTTVEEVKAREAMEKAMVALNEIDWLKLQKEMDASGNKMDITKLQLELKKAVSDLNWKRICSEIDQCENEVIQNNPELINELQRYQEEQVNKQQKLNEARQQMILNRINVHEVRVEKNRKIISL
jgi:hypothetical protein